MFFLNINKPKGISSFDVIRQLRKILQTKQIGHSGTLDPLASGVLQIAVGKATKLLDFLKSDKKYIAELTFGYISDTYDDEGEKTFVKKPDFTKEELNNVLKKFIGITQQTPPKYSAIKINGQKLCNIARKDKSKEIEIPKREIEIYSIELLEFSGEFAKIEVFCKKGTYIRSLVNDIGEILGCGAYMSNLIRTKAGNFDIENSDELTNETFQKISPIEALEADIYEINEKEFEKIKNGNFINTQKTFKKELILLTKNNEILAYGYFKDGLIKPKKVFISH